MSDVYFILNYSIFGIHTKNEKKEDYTQYKCINVERNSFSVGLLSDLNIMLKTCV